MVKFDPTQISEEKLAQMTQVLAKDTAGALSLVKNLVLKSLTEQAWGIQINNCLCTSHVWVFQLLMSLET